MAIENRYDFVMLFDVENGNPNGDPDAGNTPRIDAETGYGYITDVCLKRKIRNYVELSRDNEKGYQILIKSDKSLNEKFADAYREEGLTANKGKERDDVIKRARLHVQELLRRARLRGGHVDRRQSLRHCKRTGADQLCQKPLSRQYSRRDHYASGAHDGKKARRGENRNREKKYPSVCALQSRRICIGSARK